MVFALAGDSTITKFFAIIMFFSAKSDESVRWQFGAKVSIFFIQDVFERNFERFTDVLTLHLANKLLI
jgi:hypothetical protein